jgi:hypothetical protein
MLALIVIVAVTLHIPLLLKNKGAAMFVAAPFGL